MKYDELHHSVRSLFPSAEILDDNEGQIVIYTGLYLDNSDDELSTSPLPEHLWHQPKKEFMKYEYKINRCDLSAGVSAYQDALNKEGKDGWELVAAARVDTYPGVTSILLHWKRPKHD
jgi:hypothetical protein